MKQFINLDDKFASAQGLITTVVELAQSRDIPLHKLLRGTGIFEQDLGSLSHRFSLNQQISLLRQFRGLMKTPDSGFLLGSQLINDTNPAIQALKYSSTVGEALQLLQHLRVQLAPLLFAKPHIHEHQFYLFLQSGTGLDEELTSYIFEIYSASLMSLLKRITARYPKCSFDFVGKRPRHIQEYEKNLGSRLRFEQPFNRWMFDKTLLRERNPQASQLRLQQNLSQCFTASIPTMTFIESVCRVIYQDKHSCLVSCAEQFAMSPATFKRKLKQNNVRFSQLQDDQNKLKALYLLDVCQKPNEQVAERLAFYDIPNFRRAFKRWTGITPSQLRA